MIVPKTAREISSAATASGLAKDERMSVIAAPYKSKLIILRMTKMPMDIITTPMVRNR